MSAESSHYGDGSPGFYGWLDLPHEVERYLATLPTPLFADAAPHLGGTGAGKVVLLYEAARKVMGRDLDPGPQRIGDCFPPGTPVRMADGSEKAIEDVQVEDMVLSHLGRPQRVLDVIQKPYTGDLVTVRVHGYAGWVTATPDHRFVHFPHRPHGRNLGSDRARRKTDWQWAPIGGLVEGDHIGLGPDSCDQLHQVQGSRSSQGLPRDRHALALSLHLRPHFVRSTQTAQQSLLAGGVSLSRAELPALAGWLPAPRRPGLDRQDSSPRGIAAPIRSLTRRHVTHATVYCLAVEEDHSFIVGNFAVHNCVSWGWSGSVDLLACLEVLREQAQEFSWELRTCTEATYGLSRVEVGGQRGSYQDGSAGAWAAGAVTRYGTLSRRRLGDYDPQRAREWGARGLPPDLEQEARQHLVQTATLVTSFEQARDAIANGYPVPVCSNQGFSLTRDARGFCQPQGTWGHCMKFVGARDDDGRPALLCMNSWGPNNPSGPKGDIDIPGNSWWVEAEVAERMLALRDSYALSQFEGYPAQDIPWAFV